MILKSRSDIISILLGQVQLIILCWLNTSKNIMFSSEVQNLFPYFYKLRKQKLFHISFLTQQNLHFGVDLALFFILIFKAFA